MARSQYDFFVEIINNLYYGFPFNYRGRTIQIPPTIITPYDLLKDIQKLVDPIDIYISNLPKDFRRNARTELYRSGRGWIERGIFERKILRYKEDDSFKLVPILSDPAIGIDSSSNVFVVCCFYNYLGGHVYLERHLYLPKSRSKKEYKWRFLNRENREKLLDQLETLINISCEAFFVIHTNLINSSNIITRNQIIGLIEGCFSGYEKHPEQDGETRRKLRQFYFDLCNNTPIHCDPDFQRIRPDDVVRLVVRTLSRRDRRVQECTPMYVTLTSEESLPIQLADLIAGALSLKLRREEKPPIPCKHLFFDERKLSLKDKRMGKWAKGYFWERQNG